MNISKTDQLTPGELLRGLKLARRPQRVLGWTLTALALTAGSANLALGNLPIEVVSLTAGAGYALLLTVGYRAVVARQSTRLCRPSRATLTDECYLVETDLERVEVRWSTLRRLQETDEFMLLHGARGAVAVIPKRAFEAAELAEFSAFVARHDKAAGTGAR
ncbi:YcxB family protein [Kitasatospora sp. NBC_00070]|uniref:YcxB family protein n=1 Tax=Kitasatospora sp. NBC_00070 TaxID=2975962 RepID=UPI00324D6466